LRRRGKKNLLENKGTKELTTKEKRDYFKTGRPKGFPKKVRN